MMKEILKLIFERGLLSNKDITDIMGIQESAVDKILSFLSMKGYIRKINKVQDFPKSCKICPSRLQCVEKISTGLTYIITVKGKKFIENNKI